MLVSADLLLALRDRGLSPFPFLENLRTLETFRFQSGCPIRLYHGGRDEAIPGALAPLFALMQQEMRAAPVAVDAGAGQADHRGTFSFGLADQSDWFRKFEK